jgi:Terminase large subunit, T4likevirus-type, N-terminal
MSSEHYTIYPKDIYIDDSSTELEIDDVKIDSSIAENLIANFDKEPIAFIEVFLGRDLSNKQRFFLESTKTRKHIVAIWSRQTGKSTVMASYILWRLLYGKGCYIHGEHMNERIAIVAPIKDQLKNLYDKIQQLINKNQVIQEYFTKVNTESIICKNGNQAKLMSASPGSNIRGYTATCIVIDESQDILDSKYSADVLPFGSTTNALIIEAGTPKTKNHFFSAMKPDSGALVIKQPWYECPFISEAYVMSQKAKSTETLWKQEYLCTFADEGVVAFPSKLFEQQTDGRWNLAYYKPLTNETELTKDYIEHILYPLFKEKASFTAGLDLGKQNDNSVFVIWRTDIRPVKLYVKLKFQLGTNYEHIAEVISHFYKYFQPHEFNFDYTNEKGFAERLVEKGVAVVHEQEMKYGAITFNQKNKTEMVNNARLLLERYQIHLPAEDEELIREFQNQQFELSEGGKYKYFHPSEEHDDSLWACLLALKNVELMSMNEVAVYVNPWQKTDAIVHRGEKQKMSEVATAGMAVKYRGTAYRPAEQRRRLRF